MSAMLSLLLLVALAPGSVWTYDFPFRDPSLAFSARVEDLVSRLTVPEIAAQLASGGRLTHAPAIPRLRIAPYPWGTECLRGEGAAGPATSFPQALGMAATFSPETVFEVARATGLEVRAKFNNYTKHKDYGRHKSATCWSPVINIMRDPRWGRNQECYGEDPLLTSTLADHYVRGLQGDHDRFVMTTSTCKHFVAYGGPEKTRFWFNANVSETDLRMTFLPAFKRCVQSRTFSFMCSFNSVNGVPACAHRRLLTDVLRHEWGFRGFVVSDEGAVEYISDYHHYVNGSVRAAAAALNAGVNSEDGPEHTVPYFYKLTEALKEGLVSEQLLRERMKPLFYARMRLGEFDPPRDNPFAQLTPQQFVQSPAHRELTLRTALKSFVLLKNDGLLPLSPTKLFSRVAVVGPMADNAWGLFGDYAPDPDPRYVTTPRHSLATLGRTSSFQPGCLNSDTACPVYQRQLLRAAVRGADIVFVCLGNAQNVEAEGNDREDITLPGHQAQLLDDVTLTAKGAPIVLLLFNGGPIAIGNAKSHPGVSAIVEGYYPAQVAGEAVRRLVLNEGPDSNPAGRLPNTWYRSMKNFPPITDYRMTGRTYRYLTSQENVLYPFGYGLSYTRFRYSALQLSPRTLTRSNQLQLSVYVHNVGELEGDEVVQMYAEWPARPRGGRLPALQLLAFRRVRLRRHTGTLVQLNVPATSLLVWSEDTADWVYPTESVVIHAGGQQPYQRTAAPSNVLHARIRTVSSNVRPGHSDVSARHGSGLSDAGRDRQAEDGNAKHPPDNL